MTGEDFHNIMRNAGEIEDVIAELVRTRSIACASTKLDEFIMWICNAYDKDY